MPNTIQAVLPEKCTGCGACRNICPVNAIRMELDDDGFPVPIIDPERCVDCGLCLQKCPVEHPVYENTNPPQCYAVMASNEVRIKSSSGGFFSLAAEWILKQGGVVCGARYSDDYYTVYHTIIETTEELAPLRGSKYVQSDMGDCYRKIKDTLRSGRLALFTGTPCQVAALKSYLGKDYDNLYLVDLVCHGVPSPKLYKQFVQELEKENHSKVTEVNFRNKEGFGWAHSTTVHFQNAPSYLRKRNDGVYMNSFLKSLSIRKSCGQCSFACIPRQGDITLADFWDIHRWNAPLDDGKGTGAVLVNSPKGRKLFANLERGLICCESAPLEKAIQYNIHMAQSTGLHPQRDRFYELIRKRGFSVEKAADWALNKKYDVAQVGWWYGRNYGSMLTQFALNRVVTDMGKSVLMLEWPGYVHRSDVPLTEGRKIAARYYDVSDSLKLQDHWKYNSNAETFLVGSDQLWNWWSNRDIGTAYYFLDFVNAHHNKIAYSTSFGHDFAWYPYDLQRQISLLLSRFDAVSIREESGVDRCRDTFGRQDAVLTADPVFLCDPAWFLDLAKSASNTPPKPYLYAYILNPTETKMNAIRYQAKKLGLDYYIVLDNQSNFEEQFKLTGYDEHVLKNVGVDEWVNYIAHAEYVVTDSYHGYCFALIFKRQMCVFPNKLRGFARFNTTGTLSQTTACFVYNLDEAKAWMDKGERFDYHTVEEYMQPFIHYSREWLKTALDYPKQAYSNTAQVFAEEILNLNRETNILKNHVKKLDSSDLNVAETRKELQSLLQEVRHLNNEITVLKQEAELNKHGWLIRKIKGGIRCYKENGLRYTWNRFWKKIKSKLAP